jgi:hypothetical protein
MYSWGRSRILDKSFFHAKSVNSVSETLVYYIQRKDSAVKSASFKVFNYVGAMKKVTKYLERQEADDETLSLMKTRKIPEVYISRFASLSRGGHKEFIVKAVKNKKIKEQLLVYEPVSLKGKIKLKVLIYFPRLFYFYCNKINN